MQGLSRQTVLCPWLVGSTKQFTNFACLKDLSWTPIQAGGSSLPPGERVYVKCSFLGNSAKQERSATPLLPTLNLFWYSALLTATPLLKEQKAIMIFTLSSPVCTMVPGRLLLPGYFALMGLWEQLGPLIIWQHLSISVLSLLHSSNSSCSFFLFAFLF